MNHPELWAVFWEFPMFISWIVAKKAISDQHSGKTALNADR